jgi:hypothetical protein
MSTTFSSTVAEWSNFYVMAGTASATFLGLLFVSVSLHIDVLTEDAARTVLAAAGRTFSRFILLVIIALVFLIPAESPRGLGLPLLALGLLDAANNMRLLVLTWREQANWRALLGEAAGLLATVALPLVSSIALIVVAASILSGQTDGLDWMVAIIAVILVGAATNAWNLMLSLARVKRRRSDHESGVSSATGTEQQSDPASSVAPLP